MISKWPRSVPVRARRVTISQAWAARLDRGLVARVRVLGGLVELLHGRRGLLLRPVAELGRLTVECMQKSDVAVRIALGLVLAPVFAPDPGPSRGRRTGRASPARRCEGEAAPVPAGTMALPGRDRSP
jgi:hypothetical protein